MDISWIIFGVSLAAFLGLLLSIPVRRTFVQKKTGNLLMKIAEPSLIKSCAIFVLAMLLLIFTKLRQFRPLSQIVLAACAVLGEYMALGDFAFKGLAGVYENGILVNGSFLPFEDITCFPILQLPEDEQEKYDKSSLVLATTKKPTVTLMFASEEECVEAVEKIIEVKPELKTW